MARLSRTWWGQRFIEALERSMDTGRLGRGRAYAGPNRLLAFGIEGPAIGATVRGNVNPYFGVYKEPRYQVTIQLKAIPKGKWNAIIRELSANAAWISRLLMGEMPDRIETAFERQGVHLLPHAAGDLQSDCSCPDWANPCKHVAGTYYKVASLLDRDPFLLFQLRGMDKTGLQQALADTSLGKALTAQLTEPGELALEYSEHRYTQPAREQKMDIGPKAFWQGAEPLPPIDGTPSPAAVAAVLIKKQGDYPPFWERDNSFIEVMEEIYTRVVTKNKDDL